MRARLIERFGVRDPSVFDLRASTATRQAAFIADVNRDALGELLAKPLTFIVEADAAPQNAAALSPIPVTSDGFFVSLGTGTAFSLHCAVLICDALVWRGVLRDNVRSAVELCLQEAIANALIHGNLGVDSGLKDRDDGYLRFSRLVNARLADPDLSGRRLDLLVSWGESGLDVAVADEGAGFDFERMTGNRGKMARSGRGFTLMRALAAEVRVLDGGRCTALRFKV